MSSRLQLSRRGLFRGLGTASLVAGCAHDRGSADSAQAPGSGSTIGPDPAPLEFVLNGKPVALRVEPRTTLLQALRLDLDTTGAKEVCDRGSCGACTVHVDGKPRNACMTLAHDVAGRSVTTVEGLARGGELSALQAAFVRHDALQCGFCTSGMLMSAAALLTRNRAPSAEQIRHAIAGNTCRCGTYPHVVAAVLDAARDSGGRA